MWNNFDNSMQHDGGGGFMDDSQAQQSSTDQSDTKRGQNVVPVLIGHLNNAQDAELKMWGNPVRIITVVAIVKKVEQVTTKVTYELEDETGSITAIQWLEVDKTTIEPVKLNTYARSYGFLRETNGVKHLILMRLMPVTELAEVLSHLLEVTAVCLQAAKAQHQVANNDSVLMSSAGANEESNGMTKEQLIIFEIIKTENDSETGINRATIKERVPAYMSHKVDDILDFLSNEGHIYTTSTDDNFKTT